MIDLGHGRDVSFFLACVGPRSCGYTSNPVTLHNPTDTGLSLATDLLIGSLRTRTPWLASKRTRREVMPVS